MTVTQKPVSSVYTYAQRDIIALGGTSHSAKALPLPMFDISYTGAQIASDDDMLPDSMKGFAPVIRGTAHSNARLSFARMDLRHLPELCRSRRVRD